MQLHMCHPLALNYICITMSLKIYKFVTHSFHFTNMAKHICLPLALNSPLLPLQPLIPLNPQFNSPV